MVATQRRKWLALALLSAVQFMVVLDIAIVNVALPSIKVDLGFSQENLQWVISAYALFFGGFLLLGGRAADRIVFGEPLAGAIGAVVVGLSLRPVNGTVFKVNYRRQRNRDLVNNQAIKVGAFQIGFATYF